MVRELDKEIGVTSLPPQFGLWDTLMSTRELVHSLSRP